MCYLAANTNDDQNLENVDKIRSRGGREFSKHKPRKMKRNRTANRKRNGRRYKKKVQKIAKKSGPKKGQNEPQMR